MTTERKERGGREDKLVRNEEREVEAGEKGKWRRERKGSGEARGKREWEDEKQGSGTEKERKNCGRRRDQVLKRGRKKERENKKKTIRAQNKAEEEAAK